MTNRPLRILLIAYSLIPVSEASAGGAEQMLWTLDRELRRRGHFPTTAAAEGSRVSGEIFETGRYPAPHLASPDDRDHEHAARVIELVRQRRAEGRPFDIIHDKSGILWRQVLELAQPTLATLHLPRGYYSQAHLERPHDNLFLNCVSSSQMAWFSGVPNLMGVVRNGIALDRFPFKREKGDYLLWLGRICIEKGPHIALDIARQAGMPIILAGQVYPIPYHMQFHENEVLPRLRAMGAQAKFVELPSFEEKVELLQNARALLVSSLVDETSSLVSKEAMACGTSVVGFRRGALPEMVLEGETGFMRETILEMIEVVKRVGEIRPERCRQHAEESFPAARMASDYLALYERISSGAAVMVRESAKEATVSG